MIGREIGQTVGSPRLTRVFVGVGDRLTPVLAVIGVFTLAYNTTIDIQCRIGAIE
jgi:hypothetical protein